MGSLGWKQGLGGESFRVLGNSKLMCDCCVG